MKISQEIKAGMQEKSEEFRSSGATVYIPVAGQ
jgi:hypothetical protein